MWKNISIALVIVVAIGFTVLQRRVADSVGPTAGPTPSQYNVLNKPTLDHVGKPALDWNIPSTYWMNTSGKAIRLQDLHGKVTLIEFFRIKCPHCEAAAPDMIGIYNKFKGQGLNMIAIQSPGEEAVESDWPRVQAAVHDWRLPYPIGFDQGSKEFKRNGFAYYPTVIILDRQGIVRFAQSGYDSQGKKLAALLDPLHRILASP